MTQEQRRKQKHPDTRVFHYFNANPKNKITTDCVVRAISTATEIPYNQVVMEMAEMQCKTGYDDGSHQLIEKYLTSKGWKKHSQPRKWDNTKYTGSEFCKELMRYDSEIDSGDHDMHHIIANIGGHHIVAIISGRIYDTWNSSDGCIGNYYTK